MQADTIKLIFTLSIATLIIAGGFAVILITRNDLDASDIRLLMAGFIGGAMQFVFNRETQTQTARQVEHSVAAEQSRASGAPTVPSA